MKPERKVPALVLAAGGSTRCPGGKFRRTYGGRPLLEILLDTLLNEPALDPVLVVLGCRADELADQPYMHRERVRLVHNANWRQGLSSSVAVGVEALPEEAPGVLLTLGDTPCFSVRTLHQVLPVDDEQARCLRVPVLRGQPGHPKYFPRWLFPELLTLEGDQGAKPLLRAYSEQTVRLQTDDPGVLRDFDTPQDFHP